jgi:hypothetical protein
MFRFTIRDVLWLMVVVGFAVCWYLERDGRMGQSRNAERLYRENKKLRTQLHAAERALHVHVPMHPDLDASPLSRRTAEAGPDYRRILTSDPSDRIP